MTDDIQPSTDVLLGAPVYPGPAKPLQHLVLTGRSHPPDSPSTLSLPPLHAHLGGLQNASLGTPAGPSSPPRASTPTSSSAPPAEIPCASPSATKYPEKRSAIGRSCTPTPPTAASRSAV
ncbi:hypothetical protein BJ546DRAFT_1048953 [Cryomyces antarcticus]